MLFPRRAVVLVKTLLLLLATPAYAHTPYLVPVTAEASMGNMVSLDASFAEVFFVPEAAFNNSEFFVIKPDGERAVPATVVPLKTRVVVEQALEAEGTYRFSTGSRMGAVFTFYELDGKEMHVMGEEKPIPEGAIIKQHFQSITQADTYVSHKKTSEKSLQVSDKGLQIRPLSNPTDAFAGEPVRLQILMDNKPVKDLALAVYKADTDSNAKPVMVKTDKQGKAVLELAVGRYLVRARLRVDAPKTANVAQYSYTTTLSFEVFDNI